MDLPILEVKRVSKLFGGLAALDGVDLRLKEREFLGIIGPNGAGKTTLFNVITGFYPVTKGEVCLEGEDVTSLMTHERARKGVVRSFQQVNVFTQLTATENMLLGFHIHFRIGFWKSLLPSDEIRRQTSELEHEAVEFLKELEMENLKDTIAGSLPLGVQKKLGIAVALAAKPKVLLLDEPISGLNAVEKHTVMEFIAKTVRKKCACIIIEHHVKSVMNYCDRVAVLHFGRKIAEGLPAEIRKNKDVIAAYLGDQQ